MTVERLNRQVRGELFRLVEANILSSSQRSQIAERYPVGRWNLVSLARWFSILGVVAMGTGLVLLARHLADRQTLVEAGLLLITVACGWVGRWLERQRNMPRVGAAVHLLSAMAFQGLSFALAAHYLSGSFKWPAVLGIDCAIFFAAAYVFRNRLVLIYATISFFVWFGAQTGYSSGWGAYWLGMTYPLRYLLVGFLVLAGAYAHFRFVPDAYRGFSRVYAHFGLLVCHLAMWFLSLFGYFEERIRWSGTETERILFTLLWAGISTGCIFAAIPLGLRLLRGYGLTFLVINLYTFYFRFVVEKSAELWWFHFLLVGGTMVALGMYLEHRRRRAASDG